MAYESYELWLRFQQRLRTLIRVWRFLKNKRKGIINSNTKKPLYLNELFKNKDDKTYFQDIFGIASIINLKDKIKPFFSEDNLIDEKFFNKLNTKHYDFKIDVTDKLNNHSLDYNQSMVMPTDFYELYSEEFLRNQLNMCLEAFSPQSNLSGYVSFRSKLAPDGFKLGRNMMCNTLKL